GSSAAEFFWDKAVQQPGRRFVLWQFEERFLILYAKGFDGLRELAAKFGWFVPVKLHGVQAAFGNRARNELFGRIDKHTHLRHKRRQLTDDLRRCGDGNISRAGVIKHKTKRVGPRFDRRQSIAQICDAADFNSDSHRVLTSLMSFSSRRPYST